MCTEIQVPTKSLMVNTARARVSRGVTQLARETQQLSSCIEGMGFFERWHSSRSIPARIPGWALGDRLQHFRRPHHQQDPTDCTQSADCFPTISEQERQFCRWLQRKKFARAKDDLQRIHEDSQDRSEFPRHRRRMSMEVSHTAS